MHHVALLSFPRLYLSLEALHEHRQPAELRWAELAEHDRDVQDLLLARCRTVRTTLGRAFADTQQHGRYALCGVNGHRQTLQPLWLSIEPDHRSNMRARRGLYPQRR